MKKIKRYDSILLLAFIKVDNVKKIVYKTNSYIVDDYSNNYHYIVLYNVLDNSMMIIYDDTTNYHELSWCLRYTIDMYFGSYKEDIDKLINTIKNKAIAKQGIEYQYTYLPTYYKAITVNNCYMLDDDTIDKLETNGLLGYITSINLDKETNGVLDDVLVKLYPYIDKDILNIANTSNTKYVFINSNYEII